MGPSTTWRTTLSARRLTVLVCTTWCVVTIAALGVRTCTPLALEQRDPSVTSAGPSAAVATGLEAGVYLALALMLLSHSRINRALVSLDRRTAVTAAAILTCGLFAQLAKVAFYPLAPWTMYSAVMPSCTIRYYEYVGIHPDGRRTALNPAVLFPTLGDALEVKLGAVAGDGSERAGPAFRTYSKAIRAVAAKYNDDHRDDPITAIHVYLTSFDHDSRRDSAQRRHVLTIGSTS